MLIDMYSAVILSTDPELEGREVLQKFDELLEAVRREADLQ